MKKLRYTGALDEVFNLDLDAAVKRGEAVDVEDGLAARLLEQSGEWEIAAAAKKGKAGDDGGSPSGDWPEPTV